MIQPELIFGVGDGDKFLWSASEGEASGFENRCDPCG